MLAIPSATDVRGGFLSSLLSAINGLSGFTSVAARRIAQPPKETFVTRLPPGQLPKPSCSSAIGAIDNYPCGTLLHWCSAPTGRTANIGPSRYIVFFTKSHRIPRKLRSITTSINTLGAPYRSLTIKTGFQCRYGIGGDAFECCSLFRKNGVIQTATFERIATDTIPALKAGRRRFDRKRAANAIGNTAHGRQSSLGPVPDG